MLSRVESRKVEKGREVCQRKFRSQTRQYGQMEKQRWEESEKRRGEERREEKKREDQRRERVRRKKMQVREKVEKSRFTVFFHWPQRVEK